MNVVIASEVPIEDANRDQNSVRSGTYDMQRLLEDDAPDGLNFWLLRNNFVNLGDSAFNTPRHRHPFAQIKYLEKGASNFAPGQDIPEGAIAYFPRATFYGPQTKENCISLSMQFGFNGEHQRGQRWESRRVETMERLKERGTLGANGYIVKNDETGEMIVRDSVQAIYEERYKLVTGKELVIRPASYDAPILMHPDAFSYFEAGTGVELRHLGRFYDQPGANGDVAISGLRLTQGGRYTLRAERAQVAWSIAPGLEIDGRPSSALTFVYSPRGETADLVGHDGVELFLVEFPRLD
jgi:hypothetical protein